MLVLARHCEQSIVIRTPAGETITVTVVEIRRDRVRLGIDAPQEVWVNRSEIDDSKRRDGTIAV